MMKFVKNLWLCIAFTACVGTDTVEDFVPEALEITNPLISLKIGDSYDLMYRYLNNVGMEEEAQVNWVSSNQNILEVDADGTLTALANGQSEISVILAENQQLMDKIVITASNETVLQTSGMKSGVIQTTSSYVLTGDFEVSDTSDGVQIAIADNYEASSALPGLYVYLTNNPSTVSGALEIGEVTVFSGAHTYNVTSENLTVDTYAYLLYFCKPFNVKVGHGEILD